MDGTAEKWRKCSFCERSFAKVEHLKRHQRSHTGEKPFKCPKCDKQYARSDVLARHIQNHPTRTYKAKATKHAQPPRIGETTIDRPATQDTAAIPAASTPNIGPEQLPTDTSGNLGQYSNGPTVTWTNGNESTIHTVMVNQGSPRGRIVTAPTTDDNQEREDGDQMPGSAQEQQSLHNGNAPTNMSHMSANTLNNTQPPLHRPILPPHQSVADIFQRYPTGLLEGRSEILPGYNQYHNDSSLLYHLPSLDQSVFDSWPLPTPNYNEFHFSDDHFDYGIDAEGASLEVTTGQLDEPSNPLDLELLEPDVPMTDDPIKERGGSGSTPGPQSLSRIENLWSSKETPYPDRLVRTLWDDVAEHKADNICSDPAEQPVPLPSPSLNCASRGNNRRKMTKECRARLISFYAQTQTASGKSPGLAAASSSLSPPSDSQQSDHSPCPTIGPNISHLQLPSEETLDLSLEFYFRHVHPSLPFIHKPTFNATETPSLLLLPMILIGYSILDPCGSKTLVSQCRTHLAELCRLDLVAKARGKCSPSGLIRSMASSLLVLYLNLDEQNPDEGTAFMLCAQTLHIAERHGLYETHRSKDLIVSLLVKHSSGEDGWKLWARIESVKRLILCLVRIDTAYARLFGSAGVIDPNQVSVVLHANSILFESPTATRFFNDATNKPVVNMPIIYMRDLATRTPPASIMNDFLLLTILGNIYLSIATAQLHILPVAEEDQLKRCSFAPINLYNELSDTKRIGHPLVAMSENFAGLLRPSADPTATLLWNHLCMIITAPVEQLELALGRKGPTPASNALEFTRIWSNSAAARRAVLHAAQIFYILSSGSYMPLQAAEKKLLRVESMIFTSALVLGLYLSLSRASSSPPSTIIADSHFGGTFELLQEIDWSIIKGEGLAIQDSDLPMALNNSEDTHPIKSREMQARQFIRHGGLAISFNGELQLQDGNTARKSFLEYAYLLDQFGGSSGSGSEYANLVRSISHLAS